MGERPDDLSRDPLDRPDALGEGGRDAYPSADPTIGSEGIDQDLTLPRDELRVPRVDTELTYDYEPRRTGSGIMETIRANPVPAALTGIGLTWLFASARRTQSSSGRYYRGSTYDAAYDYPPRYDETTTSGTTTTSTAGEALGRTRDRVGETASRAQERAGEVARQAQDRVSNISDRARYQSRRANDQLQRMLGQNPLTVGALAVGVGAAVGLALPQTSREHEVMGEARDTLVEKAQEKAGEAQEKVQRVAEEAQSAAKEEAENQGLTGDQ